MAVHAYTTTVVSGDGTFAAELVSIPRYFTTEEISATTLDSLADELGVARAAQVDERTLGGMLEQLAYEAPAARAAAPGAIGEVLAAVADQPIVVVENSPSVGSTLSNLVGQGTAGVLVAEGRPFLAVAIEAGVVVVWFIAGPIQGVREGLRDATRDVTREVMTPLLRRSIRRRFPPRRRG